MLQDNTLEGLFDKLLEQFVQSGLLKRRGTQRTDSTQVLASIRTLNRIELVGETLRLALNTLAAVHPDWVRTHVDSSWCERYGERIEETRYPQANDEQIAFGEQMGADGLQLLEMVWDEANPAWLKQIPAIQRLQQVWLQNYTWAVDHPSQLRWRKQTECPPGHLAIRSPHDPQARLSKKRQTTWVGYKVHLTEVCDVDQPHFITQVTTTQATLPDNKVTESIHHSLNGKQLLPSVHLVDQA